MPEYKYNEKLMAYVYFLVCWGGKAEQDCPWVAMIKISGEKRIYLEMTINDTARTLYHLKCLAVISYSFRSTEYQDAIMVE